jgi:hypothetical protein
MLGYRRVKLDVGRVMVSQRSKGMRRMEEKKGGETKAYGDECSKLRSLFCYEQSKMGRAG